MKPAAALAGLLVALITGLGLPTTVAAPREPPVIAVPANAAGDCLGSGQVWLVVVTDTGATLANRCVGRPANGMAALQAAGLATTFAPGGYICTMGGYPARCPATYDGRFWHYYHSTNGTTWTFADTGPAGYRYPASGMIDGWCYNAAGTNGCTPPSVSVVKSATRAPTPTAAPTTGRPTTSRPAPTSNPPTTTKTTTTKSTTTKTTTTTQGPAASPSGAGSANLPSTRSPASTTQASTAPISTSPASTSPASTSPASTSSASTAASAATSPALATSSASGGISVEPSEATDSQPPQATATAPGSGGPWGVIGTGAVLVTGALAWAGWRRLRQP